MIAEMILRPGQARGQRVGAQRRRQHGLPRQHPRGQMQHVPREVHGFVVAVFGDVADPVSHAAPFSAGAVSADQPSVCTPGSNAK